MERQSLRSELREHFYRPLWGAKKQSAASLDGVVRCFPSESPVGPLTRPTGLSRAQQLIIFDTLRMIFLPSFSKQHGGFALDRAIPLIGTSHWWTTLVLRIKAQKCIQDGGPRFADKLKNIGVGENYCLSLRSRARLGSRTSIETCIETENASNLRNLFKRESEEFTDRRWEGVGGRVDLVHKFDIYKLLVGCAFREKLQAHGSSIFLPALISTEVVSNDLHSPFHFRLGLHQILDVFPNCTDVVHDCNNGVYFQGGIGVDGVATLFSAHRAKRKKEKDRLDQMREANLGNLQFDRSFVDGRSGSDWRSSHSKQKSGLEGDTKIFPPSDWILEKMKEQTSYLKRTSDSLSHATEEVKDGKLKGWRKRLRKGFFGGGLGMKGRAFLPAPHLKVGGLAGVVASFGYHKEGLDRVSVSEIGYASPGLRRRASLRWKAAFDDHPVKAYVGCSLSAQVGRMRKRLLSFTSVMAQCECTVPVALGQSAFSRRLQTVTIPSRRNLMIGPVPLRPLMNFSFTQQVFGPLRAKADYRVALETSYSNTSMQNLHPGSAFLHQLQNMRPTIVDAQFGLDVVVPGTQGAVKCCGWYTPSKKEAMIELRMF